MHGFVSARSHEPGMAQVWPTCRNTLVADTGVDRVEKGHCTHRLSCPCLDRGAAVRRERVGALMPRRECILSVCACWMCSCPPPSTHPWHRKSWVLRWVHGHVRSCGSMLGCLLGLIGGKLFIGWCNVAYQCVESTCTVATGGCNRAPCKHDITPPRGGTQLSLFLHLSLVILQGYRWSQMPTTCSA